MDYKKLLMKYMYHVEQEEYSYYVVNKPTYFSDEEWTELNAAIKQLNSIYDPEKGQWDFEKL